MKNPGETEFLPDPVALPAPLVRIRGGGGGGGGGGGVAPPRVVVISVGPISDAAVFLNGILQNVCNFYTLFAAAGFTPAIHTPTPPPTPLPAPLRHYYFIETEELICRPPYAYLEVGMSISNDLRNYFRVKGTRVIKVYLGNVLNIDVENIQCLDGCTSFPHHVAGAFDAILTSPHYGANAEYIRAVVGDGRGAPLVRAAPYVWSPAFLPPALVASARGFFGGGGDGGGRGGGGGTARTTFDVYIMEPCVSFQKHALLPLFIAEEYARQHPEWTGRVNVVNGEYAATSPVFRSICDRLAIRPALTLAPRATITEVVSSALSAGRPFVFLLHQWNNDYNYMLLELMHMHIPVVHNSAAWAEFGYSYGEEGLHGAVAALRRAATQYEKDGLVYASHAAQLEWQYSPYNVENQRAWADILVGSPPPRPPVCYKG